jgi:type VI protein secretion system component VasF
MHPAAAAGSRHCLSSFRGSANHRLSLEWKILVRKNFFLLSLLPIPSFFVVVVVVVVGGTLAEFQCRHHQVEKGVWLGTRKETRLK